MLRAVVAMKVLILYEQKFKKFISIFVLYLHIVFIQLCVSFVAVESDELKSHDFQL